MRRAITTARWRVEWSSQDPGEFDLAPAEIREDLKLGEPTELASWITICGIGTARRLVEITVSEDTHGIGNTEVAVFDDADVAFVGGWGFLASFDLRTPKRVSAVDLHGMPFFGYSRHGDVLLARSEVDLCAFAIDGAVLWSAFVEPPWEVHVDGHEVTTDVMGKRHTFDLTTGPTGPLHL